MPGQLDLTSPDEQRDAADTAAFYAAGFEIAHTGGGCTAWRKTVGARAVLVTDEDGCSRSRSGAFWLVGIYYNEDWDEERSFSVNDTIAAIDAANAALERAAASKT